MKPIGIVICNYNKSDYVINCIQSVLESKMQDFDIYVVDNASTDDSVARIQTEYGDRVHLLVNQENLGGSGGFNTGIRKVIASGYEYLMCLDNDVQVDENAIEALFTFLKVHPTVGMVGSKVYHTQAPEYIQQFGLNIDFEHVSAKTLYADVLDSSEVPTVVYCDTVAACSVMLPVKVVNEVGMLPEDNFLYWDDMEWGYLVKKAGYQVAAYGESRVVHEMGAFVKNQSPFITYYQWRNCLHFFMKYTPNEKLEMMSVKLLSNLFYSIYESMYRNEHAIAQTLQFAYLDAITNIRGKAEEGKIIPNVKVDSAFKAFIKGSINYWMEQEDIELDNLIKSINPDIVREQDMSKAQVKLKKCQNIMKLKDLTLEYCYIDENNNIAVTKDDVEVIKNYMYSLELYLYMNQKQFLFAAKRLRSVKD